MQKEEGPNGMVNQSIYPSPLTFLKKWCLFAVADIKTADLDIFKRGYSLLSILPTILYGRLFKPWNGNNDIVWGNIIRSKGGGGATPAFLS